MINCTLEALSVPETESLKNWLAHGSSQILLKLIDSKIKFYQAEGLRDMIEASESNSKESAAAGNFAEARMFQCAHDVLIHFMKIEEFHVAKLS